MAYIGMRHPVAAKVMSHTDGSAITYGTGMVLGPAVAATLTFDVADNPDYGDDIIIDNDNGINGYSATLETNNITPAGRALVLGWEPSASTAPTHYDITDAPAPIVGWGFVRVKLFKGVRSYEAFWFHKSQFSPNGINASTKKRQIEWNHPNFNVQGLGAYIDSSGSAKYFQWNEFASESAAVSWLNSKANIT